MKVEIADTDYCFEKVVGTKDIIQGSLYDIFVDTEFELDARASHAVKSVLHGQNRK